MRRWWRPIAALVLISFVINLALAGGGASWGTLTGFDPQLTARMRHDLDAAAGAAAEEIWIDSAWRGPLLDVIITLDDEGKTLTHESGWPLRALRGRRHRAPLPSRESSASGAVVLEATMPLRYQSGKTVVVREKINRVVPMQPIWSGILGNTALYTLGVLGFLGAWWLVRAGLRLPRGCCPMCGYRLIAGRAAGCPECGWRREEPA
ncbi:MAG: hypothetical protein ACYTGP_06240 [Planctomycetota bacterium]